VAAGRSLGADERAVLEGIRAQRMGEHGRPFDRVLNVVHKLPTRRIHCRLVAHALRDLVVGAGRVTTDTETADDVTAGIERNAAAERDDAAGDLAPAAAHAARWRQEVRIEGVRLVQAPK